jgi:hypothetical protein
MPGKTGRDLLFSLGYGPSFETLLTLVVVFILQALRLPILTKLLEARIAAQVIPLWIEP